MKPTTPTLALIAAALMAAPASGDPIEPRIGELRSSWRGDDLVVGFDVVDGFTEESLERARSGMPFTIRHSVELVARRTVPLWPAQTLHSIRVEATAVHDSLTRTYALERHWIRRQRGAPPVEERETRLGATEAEMRSWVQAFPDAVLCSRDEVPRRGAGLRAESVLGRRWIWFMFPGSQRAGATTRIEP